MAQGAPSHSAGAILMKIVQVEPLLSAAQRAAPKWARRVLLMAVGLVLISACGGGPRDLTAAEVIGTWTSADGGTFRFAPDGTFVASDVLGEAVDSKTEQRVSGNGTWRIAPNMYQPDGPKSEVYIVFLYRTDRPRCGGKSNSYLISDFDGPSLALFFYLDDPDLNIQYRFNRTEAAFASPTLPSDPVDQCDTSPSSPTASPAVA
jgi:hypothetical protein